MGWARKQARVRRRCCGAGGAGGGGREKAARSRAARAHLILWTPRWRRRWSLTTRRWTRWLRRSRRRRQRTSMAFPFTSQGDISHTLTLRNSVARRFSHLETTRRRSHNRQISKDFTKTVIPPDIFYKSRYFKLGETWRLGLLSPLGVQGSTHQSAADGRPS